MKFIFEVEPETAYELIDDFAKWVVDKHMGVAGILFIESLRPLSSITGQFMYAVLPMAEIFFSAKKFQQFAVILQNDKYVSHLIKRIDELDIEFQAKKRKLNKEKRKKFFKKLKSIYNKILKK